MAAHEYGKRFQESTRGRVVELLRQRNRTVEELAAELALTDNAVRTHLATLERDGIIRQEGVRRGPGAGKPAAIYAIAPEAEAGFSNAYIPLLLGLIDELSARHDAAEMARLMDSVGRRLAASYAPAGERTTRLRAATTLLRELGAVADVTEQNGAVILQGRGCAVGLAVAHSPAVCQALAALLETITGELVHEHCQRGERTSCCFHIGNAAKAEGQARSLP